jgi:hypothetical protein
LGATAPASHHCQDDKKHEHKEYDNRKLTPTSSLSPAFKQCSQVQFGTRFKAHDQLAAAPTITFRAPSEPPRCCTERVPDSDNKKAHGDNQPTGARRYRRNKYCEYGPENDQGGRHCEVITNTPISVLYKDLRCGPNRHDHGRVWIAVSAEALHRLFRRTSVRKESICMLT